MDTIQQVPRRSLVELAYADSLPTSKWQQRKKRTIPGPLFDAAAIGAFLVLGIGLLV